MRRFFYYQILVFTCLSLPLSSACFSSSDLLEEEKRFSTLAQRHFCLTEEDKITTWKHTYNLYSAFWQCQNWAEALKVFSVQGLYMATLFINFNNFFEKLLEFDHVLCPEGSNEEIELATTELFSTFLPFLRETNGPTARLIRGDIKLSNVQEVDFLEKPQSITKEEALKDIVMIQAKAIFLGSLAQKEEAYKQARVSTSFLEGFPKFAKKVGLELRQELVLSHKNFIKTHGPVFLLSYIFKNQWMIGLTGTAALDLYYEAQKSYKQKYGFVHPRSFRCVSLDPFLESKKPSDEAVWPNQFIEFPEVCYEDEVKETKRLVTLLEELGDRQITTDLTEALSPITILNNSDEDTPEKVDILEELAE